MSSMPQQPAQTSPPVIGGATRPLTGPARHPLGLPAGSVRAILALLVMGLIWTVTVLEQTHDVQPPIYLYYLMFLILGHFFAAHGHSIAAGQAEPSPLHLPRGFIRAILLLGFVGVFAWRYYLTRDVSTFADLKNPALEQPFLPFVLVGAFFLGLLAARLVRLGARSSGVVPYWFQDVMAWVALLAVLGLTIEVLIQVVINPSVPPERRVQMPHWQAFLSAVISFYFGARS